MKKAGQQRLTVAAMLLTLCTVSACVTAGTDAASRFSFADGVGRRTGGPPLAEYGDGNGGFPRADRSNWWQARYIVDSFSRLDEIYPAARSPRADRPRPWRRAAQEPDIVYDGAQSLGGGRYQYGRSATQRLTSFSMAKTIIAILVGIALEDGLIQSLHDPAERYAPGLAGSEYGRTPLRHLLTMSSGVEFREDYGGEDDVRRLSYAPLGGRTAGGAAAARLFDTRIAAPGERWYYASAETLVLAVALQGAIGRPIADYFAERVWQPIGAEADATWLVDASGLEIGYMGFNAVLRDYARLAMLLASGGRVGDRQVIPAHWLAEMTRPHFSGDRTGRWFGYGYQTWIFPNDDSSFALLGVRGQAIYVDPARKLVMVHTAVRPKARDRGTADTVALWRAVSRQFPRLVE